MSIAQRKEPATRNLDSPRMTAPTRYLLSVGGGVVAGFAIFCAFYGALYVTGYLPPPPLTNNVCADDKLVFLREHPPTDPNFLVAGSSVAWRNIDSSVIAREVADTRPLNGGFCGMQINQSAFIIDWLLDRWPGIQEVLLVTSPLDYSRCGDSGRIFDPDDARKFVFEHQASWSFYLRYFDPISLRRNIGRLIDAREAARRMNYEEEFTKYGDGPIDTTEDRGLFYGSMPPTDPKCFAALHTLATEINESGRRLMVVQTPIHPEWRTKFDPDGSFTAQLSENVERALKGTGARNWDAEAAELDGSAFTDAIHIRWSAASDLTEEIVKLVLAQDS